MNWQHTLLENIYDPTPKRPKPKVRKGFVGSSLRGRSRDIWDKAQAAKKKTKVNEAEGDIKRGGRKPGKSLSPKDLKAMIDNIKQRAEKKRLAPKQKTFSFK